MRLIHVFPTSLQFIYFPFLAQNMNSAMSPSMNIPNATNVNQQPNAPPTSIQQFNNPLQQQPIRMNNQLVTFTPNFLNNFNNTVHVTNTLLSDSTTNIDKLFPKIQNAVMNEAKARIQRQQVNLSSYSLLYFSNVNL